MPDQDDSRSMICVGSPIPKGALNHIIEDTERPDVPHLKWVQPRNMFVAFQNFFRVKDNWNIEHLKEALKMNVLYELFPILIEPREILLSPNRQAPTSVDWHFESIEFKDPSRNIHLMRRKLSESMSETLKEFCLTFQTIESSPFLTLARVPKAARQEPSLPDVYDMQLYKKRFYLEKLFVVEVTKDEFGLRYDFHDVVD